MNCNICGRELTTGDCSLWICNQCKNKLEYKKQEQIRKENPTFNYGWVCPKCGNVYAPHIRECKNCNVFYRGELSGTISASSANCCTTTVTNKEVPSTYTIEIKNAYQGFQEP